MSEFRQSLTDLIAVELADYHPSGDPQDREVRAMAERAAACAVPELGRLRKIETAAREVTARYERYRDSLHNATAPSPQAVLTGVSYLRAVLEETDREPVTWRCEGCGRTDGRYDNGDACEECVLNSFAEGG